MNKPLLYILAVFAIKTTPASITRDAADRITNVEVKNDVDLKLRPLIAHSEEEARQKGSALTLEWWPESEGWSEHGVILGDMDRDLCLTMAAALQVLEENAEARRKAFGASDEAQQAQIAYADDEAKRSYDDSDDQEEWPDTIL
jgi:hypothetical protein